MLNDVLFLQFDNHLIKMLKAASLVFSRRTAQSPKSNSLSKMAAAEMHLTAQMLHLHVDIVYTYEFLYTRA